MQTSKNTMQHNSSAPHRAAQQRPLAAAWALAAALAYAPHSAQAFNFDDLEKVEKVERGERQVREAKAQAARREEEARRQAQQQADEAARQRAASSGGQSGGSSAGSSGSSSGPGGRYSIYKDKGTAPAWAWFKREVVVQCEGGRNNRSLPSIYLNSAGRWEVLNVGRYDTFQAAATAACS